MRVAVAVVLLTGCNQLFAVRETQLAPMDAGPDADLCALHPGDPLFFDEDGDGLEDNCDNCPGIYNADQRDRDLDGVGDVCDPHPDAPGDKIVATAFFNRGFETWTPDTVDNWSILDGAAVTSHDADTTLARLTLTTNAPTPALEAKFEVLDYGSQSDENPIDVTLDFPNDPGGCQLVSNSLGVINTITLFVNGATSSGNVVPPIDPNTIATLAYIRETSGDTCNVNGTPWSYFRAAAPASTSMTATIATREKIAIQYIIVYAVP